MENRNSLALYFTCEAGRTPTPLPAGKSPRASPQKGVEMRREGSTTDTRIPFPSQRYASVAGKSGCRRLSYVGVQRISYWQLMAADSAFKLTDGFWPIVARHPYGRTRFRARTVFWTDAAEVRLWLARRAERKLESIVTTLSSTLACLRSRSARIRGILWTNQRTAMPSSCYAGSSAYLTAKPASSHAAFAKA